MGHRAFLAILTIVIVVFVTVILVHISQNVIFYPSREVAWTPEEGTYEDCMIDDANRDKYIHTWYFKNNPGSGIDPSEQPTILFFHGNSGNITHREYVVNISKHLEANLLLFDYRGFGKSRGVPSQCVVCQDGISAYDYLVNVKKLNPENIVFWGESLGGAVATHVASKRKCRSLIVMSSFSSIDDILRDKHPGHWGYSALSNLITYFHMLPSKYIISEIDCPVAILHSKEDTMIPYANAKRMYTHAKEPKLFVTIKGDHSSPQVTSSQIRAVMSFCGLSLDKYDDTKIEKIIDMVQPPT